MTHWIALTFLAVCISLAFAFMMRERTVDRLVFGLKMFFGLIIFTLVVGWIVLFLP